MLPPTPGSQIRSWLVLPSLLAGLLLVLGVLAVARAPERRSNLLGPAPAYAAPLQAAGPLQQETCPEPNDGFAQACPVTPPAKLSGLIQSAEDIDTFVIRVGAPGRLLATLTNLPADYDLHLYDAAAQLVTESQAEGTADESLDIQLATPGNYFVFVNSGRGDFNPNTPYLLVLDLLGAGAIRPAAPPQGLEPTPIPQPAAAAPPEGPPAILETVNGRTVLRRADGSAQDGVPAGVELRPGDQVSVVGDGSAALRLFGASVATINKNSGLALARLERSGGGATTIVLEQLRGSSSHAVSGLDQPGSSYTVVANKIATIARGTNFGVTLRDDGWVLVDCVDCDRNKVTAAGQAIGSGQRLAVSAESEQIWLKLYEDPPNPEPTPEPDDQNRREGSN